MFSAPQFIYELPHTQNGKRVILTRNYLASILFVSRREKLYNDSLNLKIVLWIETTDQHNERYEFSSQHHQDDIWEWLADQISRLDDDGDGQQIFRNSSNTVMWTRMMLRLVKKIERSEDPRVITFSLLRSQPEPEMSDFSCGFTCVEDQDATWTAVMQALDQIQRNQYVARMAARFAPVEDAGEGARAIEKKYKNPTQQ